MSRSALLSSLLAVFTAFSLAGAEPAKPPAKKTDAKEPESARDVRAKLARPISLPGGFDANTPLRDALEHLADRQEVPIVLDPGVPQDDSTNLGDRPVKLPKLQNVPLSTVLDLLARQTGTAYLVKPGYVEFTVPERANPVYWTGPSRPENFEKVVPMVSVDVEKRPLDQVFRDIADTTGINIALDPRAGDPGKTLVTVTLNNVPIDTAVNVLADMSGLKVVYLDRVLYVTGPKNASVLEAEQAKLRGGSAM